MSTSAQSIMSAPLGSTILYADGTPRPPERFKRKVRDWESRNGKGRLSECSPGVPGRFPATFTLHEGDFGSNDVIVLTIRRVYSITSSLTFTVEAQPTEGMALVVSEFAGRVELLHLAQDEAAAKAWMARNQFSNARIEVVGAPAVQPALAA